MGTTLLSEVTIQMIRKTVIFKETSLTNAITCKEERILTGQITELGRAKVDQFSVLVWHVQHQSEPEW